MHKTNWMAGAVVICASLAFGTMAANAASMSDCLKMGKDVRTALANHKDAAHANQARRQQRYGLEFCNSGFYKRGLQHYKQALHILGADKKSG